MMIRLFLAIALLLLSCADLPVRPDYSTERTLADHREIDISFPGSEATLVGTLFLPLREGRVAAVAVNPGSAWTVRATWAEVQAFVLGMNVGVFVYDRRGAGESTGQCCSADPDIFFEQLADDLVGAVRAVRASPEIDPNRVGVLGSSLGGWIVPLAANRAPDDISFTVVTVGGAVSSGQERVYDQLTGYDTCTPTGIPQDQIADSLRTLGPSGFDPRPSLEALQQPGIWIYGGLDLSHPADFSAEQLRNADPGGTKDWTVVILPNANHDLIENGAICQVDGPIADVFTPLQRWWEVRFP